MEKTEKRSLKFRCPQCRKETFVVVGMQNCFVTVRALKVTEDSIEYSFPEVNSSEPEAYYCHSCGRRLKVKPSEDDSTLIKYLKTRPYNRKEE